MRWPFAKYVGCGNDFILFDNRQQNFPLHVPTLISQLCHRQNGIGADGVLLLQSSSTADCWMRIFNADGSEAEMCGNGLRCFVKWLSTLGFNQAIYRIEVMQRELKAWLTKEEVGIEMGPPTEIEWNIPLSLDQGIIQVHHLNTGVPHTIIFVDNVDALDLKVLAPPIRYHTHWLPKGTNVNFVERVDTHTLKVRTYERGIEKETLACGTGATAAALAAAAQGEGLSPLTVQTRGKETLLIEFEYNGQEFSQVTLTGGATCTFRGEIPLEENYFVAPFPLPVTL